MRTRILPVAALAAVLLVGCTGGDPAPAPTGTSSSPEATSDSDSWTVEDLARVTLETQAAEGSVLGEAEGALYQLMGEDVPARVAVTEVVADEGGTIVRFTLRSADGDQQDVTGYAFNRQSPGLLDIRDLALVDPVAQSRLQPFLGTGDPARPLTLCTCSRHPYSISGVEDELTATFPPLDPSTTEVTLEFPGFPAFEGMPVTRG